MDEGRRWLHGEGGRKGGVRLRWKVGSKEGLGLILREERVRCSVEEKWSYMVASCGRGGVWPRKHTRGGVAEG